MGDEEGPAMRTRLTAAAAALLLVSGALVVPTLANAEEAPPALPDMGTYDPVDYAAEAAELPSDLVVALETDVNLTPEEFLAQGDAAVEAVGVVDALEGAGVDVLGSRLDGTELVVNVPTEEDAAVVESTGATAELGEPRVQFIPEEHDLEFAADLYDGMGWVWSPDGFSSSIYQCSIGFTGFLVSTGAKQFATAGHCTDDMTGNARTLTQTAPGQGGTIGTDIGAKVAGSPMFGTGFDVGRIAVGGSHVQKPSALTWGGGAGGPLSSSPLALTGDAAAIVGATLCKSGSRTGWTCGPVLEVDALVDVDGVDVNSVVAKICVRPGDSGGAAIIGNKAVGITSWTSNASTCSVSNGPYGGFFPMISGGGFESVASAYSGAWEMAATVSAPTVSSIGGTSLNNTSISGTVANGGPGYTVSLYLDGSTSAFATTTVNPSTRAWSISLSGAPAGMHTYQAVARYGTWSASGATSGVIKRGMTVDRLAGPDRYATAVAISQNFASADTVYIATGTNYPDALSAAPAAAAENAPLLLTLPYGLPAVVQTELQRLNPTTVHLVGSTAAIQANVKTQIESLLPGATVDRLAGPDRYATSRQISAAAFPTASVAYVATGLNFPDALSAAAAAGDRNAPVILVNGVYAAIDAPTRQLLVDMGVTTVYIAGSAVVVSSGIESSIDSIPGVSVTRLAGPDRYQTSVAVNANAFTSETTAYVATGLGFADALAGAALAGSQGSPLFISQPTCVPAPTLGALASMGVTTVRLLGSTAVLSDGVAALTSC